MLGRASSVDCMPPLTHTPTRPQVLPRALLASKAAVLRAASQMAIEAPQRNCTLLSPAVANSSGAAADDALVVRLGVTARGGWDWWRWRASGGVLGGGVGLVEVEAAAERV